VQDRGGVAAKVTCNRRLTFDGLARAILGQIGVEVDNRRLDSWTVFQWCKQLDKPLTIVIDEYDTIPTGAVDFHSAVAELMKAAADNSSSDSDVHIVVVGVAQSAAALLGRHDSIERSAREIYLRPLRTEDVLDFLSGAEDELSFSFVADIKHRIARDSLGYPYFVHLVGLECMDAMLARDKNARQVIEQDYERAIRRAVQRAYRSELRKYQKAVEGLGEAEMAVIRELVAVDDPEPARLELQRRLEQKRSMTAAEFDHAWVRLQQERRILYVSRNNDGIRFADPLMKPFLRATILRDPPPPGSTSQAPAQLDLFPACDREPN